MNSKTSDKNPVAQLREKFFEKKKKRIPSQEIKDTLRKKQEPTETEDQIEKKIAKTPEHPGANT